jgi:hypothetical protein
MSIHIPDDDAINAAIVEHQLNISAILLRCLLRLLAAALPIAKDTPESIAAETHQAARELFFAMQPHDAVEAAAAIRAVTALFAAMDMHARASRPGLSDETVMRLRARADTCARSADGRRRGKTQRPPAEPPLQEEPEPLPRPVIYQFQPRNRFGKPIPLANCEEMTMAQRRATYAPRRDPEVEAAAIADEEAMIAEQQALEAREREAVAAG